MVSEGVGLFSPSCLFLQSCHFQTAERILLTLEQELLDWPPPFHFSPSCLHLLVERRDFCYQVERGRLVEKCRAW